MALQDRIAPLCDLLLGAAYADSDFKDREREEVLGVLEDFGGLNGDLTKQVMAFDPAKFDLVKTATAFKDDPEDDRRRVLFLVAAINDADDEVDFSEDEYLRSVAKALGLPDSALAGMTVDVEPEEKEAAFAAVKKGPPPPPGKK
jgi:uncharacterized tellurite resistance protein B-like protein